MFALILLDPPSSGLNVHGTNTPETWQRRIASLKWIRLRQELQKELKVMYCDNLDLICINVSRWIKKRFLKQDIHREIVCLDGALVLAILFMLNP